MGEGRPRSSRAVDEAPRLAEALLELLPFGVVLMSRSRGVLRINPHARAILSEAGIDPEDWDGSEVASIVTTLGLPTLDAEDQWTGSVQLVGTDGPHDIEIRVFALDSEHRAVLLTPVSPARKAEDMARLLATVVAGSSDFVAWHGPIGAEPRINQAGADMVGGGVVASEPLPHAIRELFVPEDRDLMHNVGVPIMHEQGAWRARVQLRNKDSGELRDIDWAMFIVRDDLGRVLGSAGVGRDVTEQVRAEARDVQRRLLAAQEEERRRIAAGVHDDSAQALTALNIRLQRLARRVDEENRPLVDDARQAAAAALERLRRLIFDLHPTALDHEGVAAALTQFLEFTVDEQAPPITLVGSDGPDLPPESRAAGYRAAREALLNAVQHSGANRIDVTLEPDGDGIRLRIVDDGIGFDPSGDIHRPGHLGLTGARALIQAAGGRFDISSTPGAGTRVTLWVPAALGA